MSKSGVILLARLTGNVRRADEAVFSHHASAVLLLSLNNQATHVPIELKELRKQNSTQWPDDAYSAKAEAKRREDARQDRRSKKKKPRGK